MKWPDSEEIYPVLRQAHNCMIYFNDIIPVWEKNREGLKISYKFPIIPEQLWINVPFPLANWALMN